MAWILAFYARPPMLVYRDPVSPHIMADPPADHALPGWPYSPQILQHAADPVRDGAYSPIQHHAGPRLRQ